jgi:prepilin-type N-terminal cleavage/methylation domain-containing protein
MRPTTGMDGNRISRSEWTRPGQDRRRAKRAFTLVELLVVMAISVILLGLIFGPLIQGFGLLRAARVQVQAFDTARVLMERVHRDLAEGAYVFDHGDSTTNPGGSAINLWYYTSSGATMMRLQYAMLDIVPPAHLADLQAYLPANTDPTTGLPINRGPAAMPVVPGRVIVRYWLGLSDNTTTGGSSTAFSGKPVKPYQNWMEDRKRIKQEDDNRVILYRAVVSPYLPTGEVDTRLFHKDPSGKPVLYDPNFFYDDTEAAAPNSSTAAKYPGAVATHSDGKIRYSDNWRTVARALVPRDKADMVRAEHNADGTVNYTTLEPLIRFQPTQVAADIAAAGSIGDPGNETPDAPPITFRGSHGYWNTPFSVSVYRSSVAGTDPLSENPVSYYYWDGVATNDVRLRKAQFSNGTWSMISDTGTNYYPTDPTTLATSNAALAFTVDAAHGIVEFGVDAAAFLGSDSPSTFVPSSVNSGMSNGYRMVQLQTYPTALRSPLSATAGVANARIVAGSEVVKGPDMRPGPHYGKEITYMRVPRRNDPMSLGPNEYMINYADIATTATPAETLTATQLALLQKGTIIFDSRPDSSGVKHSLPETYLDDSTTPATTKTTSITVTYRLQNNLTNDVVKVDYQTREMMKFSLGVRLYDLGTGNPQQVNLAQSVQVLNLQR